MHAGRYDLSHAANRRFQDWCETWAAEAWRVLKPGGHMLVFGSPRTYHRLAAGVEDAGFEIRDSLMWLYGSGFPKSLNVSLAIDKSKGAEDRGRAIPVASTNLPTGRYADEKLAPNPVDEYEAQSPEAEQWEGWGTALKPGYEPIVVARKPLAGTVASNVLEHGTGGINIDACRITMSDADRAVVDARSGADDGKRDGIYRDGIGKRADGERFQSQPGGRWPANLILSHTKDCVLVGSREVASDGHFPADRGPSGYGSAVEDSNGGLKGQRDLDERHLAGEMVEEWECAPGCPVAALDEQSGELISGANPTSRSSDKFRDVFGAFAGQRSIEPARGADRGGASRFYYCAKAPAAERDAGLAENLPRTRNPRKRHQQDAANRWRPRSRNKHPTVKPISVMRWLVRLVTPPGGTVLDPFTGSGTTGCAAALEGFDFIGIERDRGYISIATARIKWWREHPEGLSVAKAIAGDRKRQAVKDTGQLSW
jgi:hypothetical protein